MRWRRFSFIYKDPNSTASRMQIMAPRAMAEFVSRLLSGGLGVGVVVCVVERDGEVERLLLGWTSLDILGLQMRWW